MTMTTGDWLFVAGAILETVAVTKGVHTTLVAWSLIIYGCVLLGRGYLQ